MSFLRYFSKYFFVKYLDGYGVLLQSSGKILIIHAVGALLLLLNNFLIVHFSGDQNYGTYVSILIWINLLSVITLFGMDDRLIATVPQHLGTSSENTIYYILKWSIKILLIGFLFTSILLFIVVKFKILYELSKYHSVHLYVLVFTLTLMNLLVQFLRASNQILLGQILDKIIRSILAIVLLLVTVLFTYNISAQDLIWIQFFALALCCAYIFYRLRKNRRANNVSNNILPFDKSLRPNSYFLIISILNLLIVRLDIIFLSESVPSKEVGYYNIAMRFADFIHYPVSILNLIVPSLVAKALTGGPHLEAHKIIHRTAKLGFIGTVAIFFIMLILGDNMLSLYGKNFNSTYPIIILVGLSHIATAAVGPLNALFMVSGKENLSLYCLAFHAIVILACCYFLIPSYGSYGAAYATIAGNFTYLLLIIILFYKSEKVIITPFKTLSIKTNFTKV